MSKIVLSAYAVMAAMLLIVLNMRMVPALLIGLLIFLLAQKLCLQLKRFLPETPSRYLSVVFIALIITLGIYAVGHSFSSLIGDPENLHGLMQMLQKTVGDLKADLPPELIQYIPKDWLDQSGSMGELFKEHAAELSIAGKKGAHTLVQILLSIAIAFILSLHSFNPISQSKPLAKALRERFMFLGQAFQDIVFAQVKISAVNTALTAIFLLFVLPSSGHPIPYDKILVLLTFVTGLLPVIGNLMSNTVITIIAASISLKVALACLVFLVVIHKLEYFVNAKIIGHKINAAAWEILLALLVMEALFGINGLLLAPILYAYIKAELKAHQLI